VVNPGLRFILHSCLRCRQTSVPKHKFKNTSEIVGNVWPLKLAAEKNTSMELASPRKTRRKCCETSHSNIALCPFISQSTIPSDDTSIERSTARVPLFARVVCEIFNIVGGVSTLDGIECRTFDLPFPHKVFS
jgi:hypothetical protein